MKISVVLEADVEEVLRSNLRKKGDLSRIVNEALRKYLSIVRKM